MQRETDRNIIDEPMVKTIKNLKGNETLIFAETFENEVYEQIKKLVNFPPYQDAKVRVMPDAHAGKGCSIGTTMTITDKLTPNLVGMDIGCGMLTVKLRDQNVNFAKLDEVINTRIPNGFEIHDKSPGHFDFSGLRCKDFVDIKRARLSIGSLGGGNHFIEVSRSEKEGNLYLIIHSGSRKLGADTCQYYQERAVQHLSEIIRHEEFVENLNSEDREKGSSKKQKKRKKQIPHKDLAFLEGAAFEDYMNDMFIVQQFASMNRATMAEIILKETGLQEDSRFETIHNYIDFRRMILRKGAVSAEKGETLLIPLNMRDGSLLCRGKGNEEWNYSAPHGAGRLMSRTKAKAAIELEDFQNSMANVYSTSVGKSTLDEAPQAYRSMDEIKNAITDTVEVTDVLKPLYNF
ncbi:MAG: RtcB family protein, partial [Marinilabiliaceae bacterium]